MTKIRSLGTPARSSCSRLDLPQAKIPSAARGAKPNRATGVPCCTTSASAPRCRAAARAIRLIGVASSSTSSTAGLIRLVRFDLPLLPDQIAPPAGQPAGQPAGNQGRKSIPPYASSGNGGSTVSSSKPVGPSHVNCPTPPLPSQKRLDRQPVVKPPLPAPPRAERSADGIEKPRIAAEDDPRRTWSNRGRRCQSPAQAAQQTAPSPLAAGPLDRRLRFLPPINAARRPRALAEQRDEPRLVLVVAPGQETEPIARTQRADGREIHQNAEQPEQVITQPQRMDPGRRQRKAGRLQRRRLGKPLCLAVDPGVPPVKHFVQFDHAGPIRGRPLAGEQNRRSPLD